MISILTAVAMFGIPALVTWFLIEAAEEVQGRWNGR